MDARTMRATDPSPPPLPRSGYRPDRPRGGPEHRVSSVLVGAVAFVGGFLVPWISFVGDRWLDYCFPAAAGLLFIVLMQARVTWREYWSAIPANVILPSAVLILLTGVAALRVIDKVDLADTVRFLLIPPTIYLCLYTAVVFHMTSHWPMNARVLRSLMWGLGVGTLIMAVEGLSGGLYGRYVVAPIIEEEFHSAYFNRAEMMLSIASWISTPFLARRFGPLAGIALPALIWLISLTGESEMVQAGMPVAIAVYLVALKAPGLARDAAFAAALMALLAAPFVYPLIFDWASQSSLMASNKFLVRAEIWDAVSRFALEAPVFGHGLNATRLAGPVPIENIYYPPSPIWHPHNGFLQIWADTGLLGALSVASLVVSAWMYMRSLPASIVPTVSASFTLVVLALVSTHALWSTWWLGFLALNTGYLAVLARRASTHDACDR